METTNNNHGTLRTFVRSLEKSGMSAHTIRAYVSDLAVFYAALHTGEDQFNMPRILKVSTGQVENYLQQLTDCQIRPSTIKRKFMAIRKLYVYLCSRNAINHDPTIGIRVSLSEYTVISMEKLQTALRYLHDGSMSNSGPDCLRYLRNMIVFLLMLFHGVRQSQLCMVQLSQIVWVQGSFVLRLGSELVIPIDRHLIAQLIRYLNSRHSDSPYLFLDNKNGRPITRASLRELMIELSYVTGGTISSKSLYHTYLHLSANPIEREQLLATLTSYQYDSPDNGSEKKTQHAPLSS